MPYTRGTASNVLVGAAAFFICDYTLTGSTAFNAATGGLPFVPTESYKDTLASNSNWNNVGYTMNGLELQFQPDFGEVQVDQTLDTARLFKQGMQVNATTTFAEATLENLLYALAFDDNAVNLSGTKASSAGRTLELRSGDLGECAVERAICAVGPGTGACSNTGGTPNTGALAFPGDNVERVYLGYRAISIDNVTVSAKRDEATMFEVSFRLLPEDTAASYGKIIDRTHTALS